MGRRQLPRTLVVAVLVVSSPVRTQPARWWRSPRVVQQLRLTRQECEEIDRVYEAAAPSQRAASSEVARLLNEIGRQMNDGFVEETLLTLTNRLAAAEAHEAAIRRQLLRDARSLCVRRDGPEWLNSKVTE